MYKKFNTIVKIVNIIISFYIKKYRFISKLQMKIQKKSDF